MSPFFDGSLSFFCIFFLISLHISGHWRRRGVVPILNECRRSEYWKRQCLLFWFCFFFCWISHCLIVLWILSVFPIHLLGYCTLCDNVANQTLWLFLFYFIQALFFIFFCLSSLFFFSFKIFFVVLWNCCGIFVCLCAKLDCCCNHRTIKWCATLSKREFCVFFSLCIIWLRFCCCCCWIVCLVMTFFWKKYSTWGMVSKRRDSVVCFIVVVVWLCGFVIFFQNVSKGFFIVISDLFFCWSLVTGATITLFISLFQFPLW